MTDTTICAISTAPGNGAIAVLRLSGSNSFAICNKIFRPAKKGTSILDAEANTIHFGNIVYQDRVIDEVLVSVFRNPHSYTGEDSIEISCHGSSYIQKEILKILVRSGAILAKPGEFTMRAFLNGKLDLSQAEAVADLIASNSDASHQIAIKQIKGGFSSQLKELRDNLLNFISLIELELDFSEEEVEFADRAQLRDLTQEIDSLLTKLITSFDLGNVLKNGVPVALVGDTNVGKSTLLNSLIKEDKAIVSNIAGTTRDVVEDVISIDGINFRFFDTAGIRKTENEIEAIGIQKSIEKINKAKINVVLIDTTSDIETIKHKLAQILSRIPVESKIFVVFNKIDTLEESKLTEIKQLDIDSKVDNVFHISAKHNIHIDELLESLVSVVSNTNEEEGVVVSNIRHYEALMNAQEALQRGIENLANNISGDFIAMDIREVLHYLGEITGEINTDEMLGNIFANFCIGK